MTVPLERKERPFLQDSDKASQYARRYIEPEMMTGMGVFIPFGVLTDGIYRSDTALRECNFTSPPYSWYTPKNRLITLFGGPDHFEKLVFASVRDDGKISKNLAINPSEVRMRQIKIVVEKHPDVYVAYPLGLKGVVIGQGDTYEAALDDVKSAIQFHLETFGPEALEVDPPILEAFVAETRLVI